MLNCCYFNLWDAHSLQMTSLFLTSCWISSSYSLSSPFEPECLLSSAWLTRAPQSDFRRAHGGWTPSETSEPRRWRNIRMLAAIAPQKKENKKNPSLDLETAPDKLLSLHWSKDITGGKNIIKTASRSCEKIKVYLEASETWFSSPPLYPSSKTQSFSPCCVGSARGIFLRITAAAGSHCLPVDVSSAAALLGLVLRFWSD